MDTFNINFKNALFSFGADRCGFGDISELPPESRNNLPVGVSVAVFIPAGIIKGISDLPTREYFEFYTRANELLDSIVTRGAEYLMSAGYTAFAQTRAKVGSGEMSLSTLLPHKTVATRAGIGWIGKCALLITEDRGPMLRLSSILTDAPLETERQPIDKSRCGKCNACVEACPGGAVSGRLWEKGMPREAFFDAEKCRDEARERSRRGFGGGATICGKCIEACPYARRLFKAE